MIQKKMIKFLIAVLIIFPFCTASAENILTNADFVRIGDNGLPYG